MYAENMTVMKGEWERVWDLASRIELWPNRLPHYRKVSINHSNSDATERDAYMSAWRDILPVSWTSIQRLQFSPEPAKARIFYQHIHGVTKGMEVVWLFEPLSDQTYRVIITHEWKPRWLLIGGLASTLIGELIIKNIADKTLATVKRLAIS